MESFFQTASQFRYLKLLVLVDIERRKLHGLVASVSRAPHQLQHWPMRTTRLVAFRSSGATKRFWLFALTTFDHDLKELAPQTVCVTEQKTGRFVVRDLLDLRPLRTKTVFL